MNKFIAVLAVTIPLIGCVTPAIKAWDTASFEKTLGTADTSFIKHHNSFSIKTGNYHWNRFRESYSTNICKMYNEDEQLVTLKKKGIIDSYPKCLKGTTEGSTLQIEVGTARDKCIPLINCLDKYIKYSDGEGNILAYSKMKELPYMEGIRYSIGHIKNMIIAANLESNRDNPEWKANLERVCKEDKTLKSVCN